MELLTGTAGGFVNSNLAAAIVAVAGTLAGAALGAFLQWHLQRRGSLHFHTSGWGVFGGTSTQGGSFVRREVPAGEWGHYGVTLEVFNGRPQATGLRETRIVFTAGGVELARDRPDVDSKPNAAVPARR